MPTQSTCLPRYQRFESYQEFEAFDQWLSQQLATGQLLVVAPAAGASSVSAYYQLADAAPVWALSEPDNAWRGYFLPLEEALAYEDALRSSDQRARLGCLLVIALLSALAAWRLLS